ncbi:MAG: septum formation initiator family protein [Clostridia bacterium]|nr:septum formation initiator family protein [Clostridia bacterium]MBQ4574359.1 septum formation initiator family protein [Clostridia bacterium]
MRGRANIFVKAAVVVFVCFCVMTIIRLNLDRTALMMEEERLNQQIEEYTNRIEELNDELARPYDDEYVMRVAREKLNYHLPEEIIFFNDLNK